MRASTWALWISVVFVSLFVLYPFLIWSYCLLDDYVLRPDDGTWVYDNGTFWHTENYYPYPDGTYDRQIDLWPPLARWLRLAAHKITSASGCPSILLELQGRAPRS